MRTTCLGSAGFVTRHETGGPSLFQIDETYRPGDKRVPPVSPPA